MAVTIHRDGSIEQHPRDPTTENRILRRLLALRVAGPALYVDDDELQDNSAQPFIDFKRDSAEEIERKIIERGRRQLEQGARACSVSPPPAS